MNVKWPEVKLGEVLRLDLDTVPVDPTTSYPMVGVLSFGRGLFDREPIESGNTSYKRFFRLKAEHVVMSQLFGWEGALALSTEQHAGQYVSPQFPTFLCDSAKLDRHFLGWIMKQKSFWDDLGSRATGMGDRRRTLNPDALFACNIPLPPLPEQRRIAVKVEQLAGKLGAGRALQEGVALELDLLARSILANDRHSIPTPIQELVCLRPPDIRVRPDESYDFAGVYCFGRGVFRSGSKSGMEFAYPQLTTLHAGDFVYPKLMAWEGALGIVPPECDGCVVSTEFPVFEVMVDRVFPEVLDTHFRNPAVWPTIASLSTGTNVRRRRLNPQSFLKYVFPLPSQRTQQSLREVLAKTSKVRRLLAQTAAQLDALLPSLLDRALSGGL